MTTLPREIRELLDAYIAGPAMVRAAVAGVDAGALNRRPPGDDWSIRDVLLHLADAEMVGAVRIRLALAEDSPLLPVYEQDAWKRRLQYLWRDPEVALSLFQQVRWSTAEILDHSGADAWQRRGIHPDTGPVTVAGLVEIYVEHVELHVRQIERARGE